METKSIFLSPEYIKLFRDALTEIAEISYESGGNERCMMHSLGICAGKADALLSILKLLEE